MPRASARLDSASAAAPSGATRLSNDARAPSLPSSGRCSRCDAVFVAIPSRTGLRVTCTAPDYFQITAWRGLDNYWSYPVAVVQRSLAAPPVHGGSPLVFHPSPPGRSMRSSSSADSRLSVSCVRGAGALLFRCWSARCWLQWAVLAGGILPRTGSARASATTILGDPDAAMAALVSTRWRDSAFAMIFLARRLMPRPAGSPAGRDRCAARSCGFSFDDYRCARADPDTLGCSRSTWSTC